MKKPTRVVIQKVENGYQVQAEAEGTKKVFVYSAEDEMLVAVGTLYKEGLPTTAAAGNLVDELPDPLER